MRPSFTGANFLLYLGAFVTLFASYGFLDTLSAGQAFALSSLEMALLLALAAVMYYGRRPISGGLLGFVVAGLAAVWAASLLEWLGWWPAAAGEPFHAAFHGPYLIVELVVVAVSAALLFATRFPLVGLVTAVALWYLLADNAASLFDHLDGDRQAGVAFAAGLVLMGAASLIDETPLRGPSFWLHLVGLASFYVGMFVIWTDTDAGWLGILVVSAFAVLVATALTRSAYAVFGGIGLLAGAGHFVDDWVGELFGLSLLGLDRADEWRPWLAYAAVGLVLMLIGMLVSLGEGQDWRRFFIRVRAVQAPAAPATAELEPGPPLSDIEDAEDAELTEEPLSRPAGAEPVEGVVDVDASSEVVEPEEPPSRPL